MTPEEIEAAAELLIETFGHLNANEIDAMLDCASAIMCNRRERRRAMAMKPRCLCPDCLRDPDKGARQFVALFGHCRDMQALLDCADKIHNAIDAADYEVTEVLRRVAKAADMPRDVNAMAWLAERGLARKTDDGGYQMRHPDGGEVPITQDYIRRQINRIEQHHRKMN
jgi:hypothetical protein